MFYILLIVIVDLWNINKIYHKQKENVQPIK